MGIDVLFNEYCVIKSDQRKIMDIMDRYRKLIDEGQKVTCSQFENDIVTIFGGYEVAMRHNPAIDYHFCEYVAKGFADEGRWVEVFQALYSEFPKYGGKIN